MENNARKPLQWNAIAPAEEIIMIITKYCLYCQKQFKPKRKEQVYCSIICSNSRHIKENMRGKTFGNLTVIKFSHFNERRMVYWLCKCICGSHSYVSGGNLRSGAVKSCGCIGQLKTKKRNLTHGFSKTQFYSTYRGILERCNNISSHNYKWYGGKGIKCLWKSFEEFRDDMHESYLRHINKYGKKNTTIDRVNSNDHYYKENCRWATWEEQLEPLRKKRTKLGRYGKQMD